MNILFDQGTPAPLRRAFPNAAVETVYERGWSTLQNGQLLAAAEQAGFDVFITTDQNLKYQQNLIGRHLTIVVLSTTSWPRAECTIALRARA
jgi:predicted nuclease of predicted toxin-antitoxin system